MTLRRFLVIAAICGAMCAGTAAQARAATFTVTIFMDENGNGLLENSAGFSSPLAFSMSADPGPGGLASALTYDLLNPPGLVDGDVLVLENVAGVDLLSDWLRFNPATAAHGGSLVVYSDTGDADLADIGFPTALYTNAIRLFEVGPEGANGLTYTPVAGQPGFVAGAAGPVTYVFTSDAAAVPEPGTLLLLGTGVAIALRRRMRA